MSGCTGVVEGGKGQVSCVEAGSFRGPKSGVRVRVNADHYSLDVCHDVVMGQNTPKCCECSATEG